MNRQLPSWIAVLASGVLATAAAFAQGGENPRPAGDKAAGAHPSEKTDKQADAKAAKGMDSHGQMDHGKDMHATKAKDAKHAKAKTKSAKKDKTNGSSTSSSGTASARGMNSEMSRCTSMTDRRERAECARTAWEREHGTAG